MSVMKWNETGKKIYETGAYDAALFTQKSTGDYNNGVAWDGFTGFTESPSGAEVTTLYANNGEYANITSAEKFSGTIKAYMYPPEFEACDGSKEVFEGITVQQQTRLPFGIAYKTNIGNDTQGTSHGFKLHIVYGCTASPSEVERKTTAENTEAIEFSWSVKATPLPVPDAKPSATMVIDSTKTKPAVMKAILDKIYGTESEEPTLLTPTEIIDLAKATPVGTSEING